MKRFIVEIETGVWLAPWEGDPGRTLVRSSAKRFVTRQSARRALANACMYHPFKAAKIEEIEYTF